VTRPDAAGRATENTPVGVFLEARSFVGIRQPQVPVFGHLLHRWMPSRGPDHAPSLECPQGVGSRWGAITRQREWVIAIGSKWLARDRAPRPGPGLAARSVTAHRGDGGG
jgi:hypothetical protein